MANNDIRVKMDELKKRAQKRSISFSSNSKTNKDAKIENEFFSMMQNQIYNQIVRK